RCLVTAWRVTPAPSVNAAIDFALPADKRAMIDKRVWSPSAANTGTDARNSLVRMLRPFRCAICLIADAFYPTRALSRVRGARGIIFANLRSLCDPTATNLWHFEAASI